MVKYEQPAAVAHSDYTPGGAIEQLKGSFRGQETHFLNREFDMIKCVLLRIHVVLWLMSGQCLETVGRA